MRFEVPLFHFTQFDCLYVLSLSSGKEKLAKLARNFFLKGKGSAATSLINFNKSEF